MNVTIKQYHNICKKLFHFDPLYIRHGLNSLLSVGAMSFIHVERMPVLKDLVAAKEYRNRQAASAFITVT